MKNLKNIILVITFSVLLLATSIACITKPQTEYSDAERRPLASLAKLNLETIFSGEFVESVENYTADQFPKRDWLRSVKSFFVYNILKKSDNNGIYYKDSHLSKIEYPQNTELMNNAADKFTAIYDTYLKDTTSDIYLTIVPDKNYFLAKDGAYLSLDYEKFNNDFSKKIPFMQYLDINPLLEIDDFYRTDSHWKQESITDIAKFLANSMGTNIPEQYTKNTLETPFSGVYLGQSALPVEPDTINYLTGDIINGFKVTYYDTGIPKAGQLYNMEKAHGKDPYEMFLSGTTPLVVIENPSFSASDELILFRDSYGSSIAPLLAQGYKKVTVVDIRYMQSSLLGSFIDFNNQDILFLYSTTLLNNSLALK